MLFQRQYGVAHGRATSYWRWNDAVCQQTSGVAPARKYICRTLRLILKN